MAQLLFSRGIRPFNVHGFFNPLSPDMNMYIPLTVSYRFLMKLKRIIFLNI